MQNTAYFLIITIALVVVLIYGQSLLVPFVFALLLWFIMREMKQLMDKVAFVKEKVPSWAKSLVAAFIILGVLGLISKVLSNSINSLAGSYKDYEPNVALMITKVNTLFNIDLTEMMKGYSTELDLGKILGSIFNSLTDMLSNAFMILLYVLFIFLEETSFQTKLKHAFSSSDRYDMVIGILNGIERSVGKYLSLKTLTSITTGILSYLALLFIGIDTPEFWAFLIFLLNYIPTIGSLVATLFPATYCLLQFGEFTPALLALALVGGVQVLVGNIIEPKLMGNSMNISPLMTVVALTFWGALWGVTGMFLSVPITVIMIIILSQFERTRPVAIMLSEKGQVHRTEPE